MDESEPPAPPALWRRIWAGAVAIAYAAWTTPQILAVVREPWPQGLRLIGVLVATAICWSSANRVLHPPPRRPTATSDRQ